MAGRAPGMMGGLSVAEKKGKFNVEEFDQLGLINGQPAQDIDLESIEDKPWKKPGKYPRESLQKAMEFVTSQNIGGKPLIGTPVYLFLTSG